MSGFRIGFFLPWLSRRGGAASAAGKPAAKTAALPENFARAPEKLRGFDFEPIGV